MGMRLRVRVLPLFLFSYSFSHLPQLQFGTPTEGLFLSSLLLLPMVSIPCNYSSLASSRPHKLPYFSHKSKPSLFYLPYKRYQHIDAINSNNSYNFSSSSSQPNKEQQQQQYATLFPGGFKRPEIKVPTLILSLSAQEVLALRKENDSSIDDTVSSALANGVGIVVLESQGGDTQTNSGGGGILYEAACILKSVVRDRAYLLISERVDIAAAVGASGVLLSDQGLPTIVARNMMMKSKPDTVYLPLVARVVHTTNSAVSASSSEGADFLIMSIAAENSVTILGNSVFRHVKVPIFVSIVDSFGENLPTNVVTKLLESGASGIVISVCNLRFLGDGVLDKIFSTASVANRILQDGNLNNKTSEVEVVKDMLIEKKGIAGFTKLDIKVIQLIESERLLLQEAIDVIQEAAPMMKEVGLLVDSASRLSEPFLLVTVGEFNSGKSTVINALLGRRYLKEGVIPTTNEITLLCYSEEDFDEQERCQRHPDGQFICYLSSPILKNINLVDTPGTNVILQRQQRLTEEFVPRADLILFVLSSDRPLTESEVNFLLYVQEWKKKVVFVLNKLDIYRNISEVEETTAFIQENTRRLLNLEDIRLYPVSARSALEAKLSASNYGSRNYEKQLHSDPRWIASRFYELEKFLFSFLDGSTDMGTERMRIKLETPIDIADRLLMSCARLVKQDYENARQDLLAIKELVSTVDLVVVKMENKSISWRKQIVSLIETTRARAVKILETTLQLSNIDLIARYAFKGENTGLLPITSAIQNEIINPALDEAQSLLSEYSRWLLTNNAREGKLFLERLDREWCFLVDNTAWLESKECGLLAKGEELSTTAMKNFSASAAARLFEQEIREVVLGTFGGLGAAGLSASLLTSVLPTTVEDLLALGFCSAGGLLAISNFPGRRKQATEKVMKVADRLAREVEEAMQKDLIEATQSLAHFVETTSIPYQEAAQRRIDGLSKIQDELAKVERKLQDLKVKIQTIRGL